MTIKALSTFQDIESEERFVEGIKKAASCCRELAKIRKDQSWLKMSHILMAIYAKGEKLKDAKSMTRGDTLHDIDRRVKILGIQQQ